MEKALLDWPIMLANHANLVAVHVWYQSEVSIDFKKVLGREVFSPEHSLNRPKATRLCIRSVNQSNRCISVRLLFLFCSRVFILRLHENRSNRWLFLQRSQPGSEDQSQESVKEELEKTDSGGAGGGGGGGGGGWQSWVTGWYSWYGTDTPDGSADKTQGKDSAAPVFMAEPPTTKG